MLSPRVYSLGANVYKNAQHHTISEIGYCVNNGYLKNRLDVHRLWCLLTTFLRHEGHSLWASKHGIFLGGTISFLTQIFCVSTHPISRTLR